MLAITIGGVLTGVASCAGIWLLYSAYAVGPMATLEPVVVVLVAVLLALVSGAFDATANSLVGYGLTVGDLSTLSVVSGFYPVVTIALALIVLREHPTRRQRGGIALAIVSPAGMSLSS
ncbi:MAG: hypothetical protein QM658_02035 [Gordonia sp. (in: high G+C Gram-positive bacteria)]